MPWMDVAGTPAAGGFGGVGDSGGGVRSTRRLHEHALRHGVALNDGGFFGGDGNGGDGAAPTRMLRLNFACPRATLERGLERLARAMRT